MTSKTKNRVGHAFIATTLIVITFCLTSISRHNALMNNGRNEVLNEISGDKLKNESIKVTYQYAHGIDILHANKLEDDSKVEPDFTVTAGKEIYNFVYVKEDQTTSVITRTRNLSINILKKFDGKVTVKNNICGCEGLINLGYFAVGAVISLVLVLIAAAFYYSARDKKIKDLVIPEKES